MQNVVKIIVKEGNAMEQIHSDWSNKRLCVIILAVVVVVAALSRSEDTPEFTSGQLWSMAIATIVGGFAWIDSSFKLLNRLGNWWHGFTKKSSKYHIEIKAK